MNPEPTKDRDPSIIKVALPAKRRHIPNVLGCVCIGFVILALLAVAMPGSCHTCIRGNQTKSLAQAKQIGLALKIFAEDHDGKYPGQGVPTEMTKAPTTANAAFAPLFPTYTTSEQIFGNKLSAYQTRQPDNVIDSPYTGKPVKTLEPGENVYAYVAGLTDKSPADSPIVLDGTSDGTTQFYNSDPKKRGGVWGGRKVVVIYLDNHGAVETPTGPENARYVEVNLPGRPQNLLDFSWLGGDVHLLDPAVAGH